MVRVQHSLTRLFEAVPHMEGVMFNTSRTHLMLHRAWVEASSKPSTALVKCWGFILFAGLNYLFTLPMRVWPAQGGAVTPPAPTQLCRAKRKNTFWQLLCDSCGQSHSALFSKIHGHLNPAHPPEPPSLVGFIQWVTVTPRGFSQSEAPNKSYF